MYKSHLKADCYAHPVWRNISDISLSQTEEICVADIADYLGLVSTGSLPLVLGEEIQAAEYGCVKSF